MLRTSKILLISLLIFGGYFGATSNPAQAESGVSVQKVSENPPSVVRFISFYENVPDYDLDINKIRVVGNNGNFFLHLLSTTTGVVWLERFETQASIRLWLETSKKSNYKGAIPLGSSY